MFTLKCSACGAESKLSFVDDSYEGPRRCWKCHGAFELKVVDNELVYCEPITEEEFRQMQEANALRNKMKGR